MQELRVHSSRKITPNMIRREQVNGADSIIIRSATLPDNVVMNGGLYPAEEIESSYKGLERKLAPLGHPMLDGKFISAADPHAVHNYDVGAYVANVSRENGRVFHDTVINVDVAGRSDKGRKLLDAINAMEETGEPIHTSTGIYLKRQELDAPMTNAAGQEYSWIATNMQFDHNAILINEEGAATPQQGVGLAVNSAGEELELMTVNEDDEYQPNSEQEIDEEKELQGMLKGMVSFIKNMAFAPRIDAAYNEGSSNTILHGNQTEDSEMTPEDKAALVADITEQVTANLAEAVTSAVQPIIQPLAETVGAIQANMQANEDAERAPLAEKAKAKGLEPTDIDAMSTNALKVMFGAPADKSATYVTGGEPIETNSDDYKTVMPNSKKGG